MKLMELENRVGEVIGVSEWMAVDQFRINAFADCTEDRQWIHVDEERAKRESPFKGPVAHGFLTLSLLTRFQELANVWPSDALAIVNYGLDRVRFLNPVPTDARLRNSIVLTDLEDRGKDNWAMKLRNTVEIEHHSKPAMIADSILLAAMPNDVESNMGEAK